MLEDETVTSKKRKMLWYLIRYKYTERLWYCQCTYYHYTWKRDLTPSDFCFWFSLDIPHSMLPGQSMENLQYTLL